MSTPTATVDRSGLPVIVIGAGPVGLAAAAHLLERGLEPLVLEAGDDVGSAVRAWSHVRLFSPWQFDLDAAAVRLLEPTGWTRPEPTGLPTGGTLVSQYLAPLAAVPALAPRIRTGERVIAVSRVGMDKTHQHERSDKPFLIRTQVAGGAVVDHQARAVIDASGTWNQSNPLGAAGLPASGEREAGDHLSGPLPDVLGADRARFADRRVLVVGAGHSATNTLLDLVALAEQEPGTVITWAVRGASVDRTFGGGDRDGLPARGALGSRMRAAVEAGHVEVLTEVTITALETSGDAVAVATSSPTGDRRLPVDVVVNATGFRPDLAMLREVRLDLDPGVEAPRRLAPLIDPEFHSCGTVPAHGADVLAHPDTGFFIAGVKSYGRAPTFLLTTGYEQVRSIAAALAGDAAAARRRAARPARDGSVLLGAADGPDDSSRRLPGRRRVRERRALRGTGDVSARRVPHRFPPRSCRRAGRACLTSQRLSSPLEFRRTFHQACRRSPAAGVARWWTSSSERCWNPLVRQGRRAAPGRARLTGGPAQVGRGGPPGDRTLNPRIKRSLAAAL